MSERRRHQPPPPAPRVPTVCRCPEPMIDEDGTDDAPLCWRCQGVVLPQDPEAT